MKLHTNDFGYKEQESGGEILMVLTLAQLGF